MRRTWRNALLAAIALNGFIACSTVSEALFPANGSLRLDVVDSGLFVRGSELPRFLIAVVHLESATVTIAGLAAPFEFVEKTPCIFSTPTGIFSNSCLGPGVVLGAGESHVGESITITISGVEMRRVEQPSLVPDADDDEDGVPNRLDNCPVLRNRDQSDENGDGLGDACAAVDSLTGLRIVPDQDDDGTPDRFDNCPLVPNKAQTDTRGGRDGIGDDCERFIRVNIPQGSLVQTYPAPEFTIASSRITRLVLDLNSRESIVCSEEFTSCKVTASAMTLSVSGG